MADTGTELNAPDQAELTADADVVVGILSFNNSDTIGGVIQAALAGASECFPGRRCLLVNADGGSKDGTQAIVEEAAAGAKEFVHIAYPIAPVNRLSPEYLGVPGKTSAIKSICGVVQERRAKVCIVLDSNVRSLESSWLGALARPVLEDGYDLVSPCYLRHRFDGAILSGIVYPFTRALYGRRVFQPMGGEFAMSGPLAAYLLRQPQVNGNALESGSDLRITIQAITGGFRLSQAFLGQRILGHDEPAPEVSSVLAYTLNALFTEMEHTVPVWQRIRGSERIPAFGQCGEISPDPASVDINPLIQSFRLGYQSLQDIWRTVLPPATWMDLKRMSAETADTFRFEDALWARVVYDFALAWKTRVIDRDHLLRAMTPLYLAWFASWIRAVRDADAKQTLAVVEALCFAFEMQKSHFISRWRWPDRFNP